MNKLLAILLVLLTVVNTHTDKEILQQVFHGIFTSNSMHEPTTIIPCIDDATAQKTVVFMGLVMSKAAQGSI